MSTQEVGNGNRGHFGGNVFETSKLNLNPNTLGSNEAVYLYHTLQFKTTARK